MTSAVRLETLAHHDEEATAESALALARWGCPVFPLKPRTKLPATPRGFKDASRDPRVIREWWERNPAYGVGVVTGHGLAVLDVDVADVDGGDTLAELERQHGKLPDSPMVLTGSGGAHWYFDAPPDTPSRPRFAPGLDLKAGGGYVVAPPSIHPNGEPYRWDLGDHPGEEPLVPIPEWLLGVGKPKTPAPAPALPKKLGNGQGRNNALTSLAGTMRRRGAEEAAIVAALRAENASYAEPLEVAEVEKIARSVVRYPPTSPPEVEDDGPWYIPAAELEDTGPVEWLVERLVRPGITFPAAEPKSGKTWLSLELAVAIVTGSPAFGRFEVPNPGPVLYVVEEGSAAEVRYRIGALCAGRGIPMPSGLLVAVGQGVMLDEKRWQEKILAAAQEGLRAVIFDPLVRMHTADESRAESMRPVNSFLRTVAYTGTSVLVNHHWTKPNEANRAGRQGNRLRGTGDFWALCDSILYLSRLKGSPSVVVETEHRSAVEEPAWSFSLPTEQDPERVILQWTPGGVEEIKAQQRAPEVLEAIRGFGQEGITRQVLQQKVGGRAQDVDAAAAWLVGQGAVARTEEERPDKRGRMRTQVVFRGA